MSWGELEIDGPPDYTLQAGWPLAQTLRWQGTLLQPMAHAPGEAYCYVNANFNLAGYVVERVGHFENSRATYAPSPADDGKLGPIITTQNGVVFIPDYWGHLLTALTSVSAARS